MKRVIARSTTARRGGADRVARRGPRPGRRPHGGPRDGAALSLTAMASELRLLHGARAAHECEQAD